MGFINPSGYISPMQHMAVDIAHSLAAGIAHSMAADIAHSLTLPLSFCSNHDRGTL